MILEEKHQKVAIEIVQRHRTKKTCNKCYDRGYIGFTPDKTIVPCEKCVDIEKAMEEWKNYVAQDEVLKEEYKELFEEEKTADETEPETKENSEQTHAHIQPQTTVTPKKVERIPVAGRNTTVRKSGNR
jgi:hypothetical protein